ncbi:MAG TPA: tetratricopeptide repeat protein [Bryobacteraceae bacterium]|nr:tetratricopeptide repeat protein [Bryobacteraceae bacterium]
MIRALCIVAFLVTAGLAQKPDNILERVRNSSLPAAQREELLRALSTKDYDRAADILNRQAAVAGKPLAAELGALAGAVDFLGGRMDGAARAFAQSDALVPLDDRDRFTWAMALVNLGDAKDARIELMRLNNSRQNTALYLYWLGRMDYEQRLYREAVDKFRQVIRLEPDSSRAYDNLGLSLDMLGQPDEARQAFLKGAELNRALPKPSPWPPHNLGALLLRQQQLKEAETALRESLRYDAGFSMAHYHLGRVLDAEGRDDETIAEYRAATTLDPPVLEAFYSLGLVYRRRGRRAEADAVFAEYKRRKSQSPP